MVKIFYYELRRLLGNRFTVGLLLVALLYGYWTMRGEILLGIANTAPFSPWSFGAYLAEMMPLLLVALLCFLSILTSDTRFPKRSTAGFGILRSRWHFLWSQQCLWCTPLDFMGSFLGR